MDVGPQLAALADPTRRSIYDLIRRAPSSVRELTDQLPISQPAVSQHLRVLDTAGLVTVTPRGTRRIYTADPDGVAALRAWIDTLWDDVLDTYTRAARKEHQP
jgi:DNA-binding transcriptional ArsR family regulator